LSGKRKEEKYNQLLKNGTKDR